MLASQVGLDLNYLGAKIAFSRVPEEAEFLY
jgi:DNA polymerase-4